MASNKVATIILLDVGVSVSNLYGEESFFKKCQWCVQRFIQRKIFSGENDELAIVLFGSKETDNNLNISSQDSMYSNICEYTYLQKPTWDIYDKVQKLNTTEIKKSNWIEGLIVSLNYLKNQIKNKRFKDKQIVILSNFDAELDYKETKINLIVENLNENKVKLIIIGVDLEEECKGKVINSQLQGSIGLMFTLVDKVVNGVSLSFEEAEDDIIYYQKKSKMTRFSKVNLCIGSKILIPIRWIKLNSEPTRIKWLPKPLERETVIPGRSDEGMDSSDITDVNNKNNAEPELKFIMENQKVTKFGDSKVILSYADLEAMKRQTGPPSCNLLGCVKRKRIDRKVLVGKDIYLVLPEKFPKAQAMISAFIDALIEADKFALVRRVAVNNGKVKIGVLVPVSDEIGKVLYFLQLPFEEHSMVVPDVILPEPNNEEILSTIDNLIDAMIIPVKPKELLIKDPAFQFRCHLLSLIQSGQFEEENLKLPDFIKNLYDPFPELLNKAFTYIEKLESALPIQITAALLDSDELNDSTVSLKGAGNMFQEEGANLKIYINKEDEASNSNINDSLSWVIADTEEMSQVSKDALRQNLLIKTELPSIVLEGNILKKNKYDNNYISNRLWNDYGHNSKMVKRNSDIEMEVVNEDSENKHLHIEMQEANFDESTDEVMQKIKTELQKKL